MTTTQTASAYPGLFDDGHGPRDVLVRPAPTRLEIRDRRGLPVALWPYAEIALDTGRDGEALSRAIHLTRHGRTDATLNVFDPALATDLRPLLKAAHAAAPDGRRPRTARRPALPDWRRLVGGGRVRKGLTVSAWVVGLLGLGVGLYAAVAATAPVVAARMAPSVPADWGVTWGATLAADAGARCEDPAGREALEALVGRLEASAGPDTPTLELHVVDDASAEARALPGGHILLTRGMIDALRTPDELAGVLAHAIADARTHGPARALLGTLRPGELMTVWREGAQTPPALLSAATARARPAPADLAETDTAAIALLRDAGLRTRGLAAVHDVLASGAARDGRTPLYLRTHPVDAARMARLRTVPAGGAEALPWDRWLAAKVVCGPRQTPALRGITG